MIRYVIVVVLTTAILGVGFAAVDYGAAVHGEREAATVIETIDQNAVNLYDRTDPPIDGNRPAQRTLDLEFPGGEFTSDGAGQLTFSRVKGWNLTEVTYRIPGRSTHTVLIEAPIHRDGSESFDIAAYAGTVTVVLKLIESGDGSPVITLTVDQ